MEKKYIFGAVIAGVCAMTSCTEDGPSSNSNSNKSGDYVVVATSSDASYILQSDNIREGNLSILNSGMEVDNSTAWVFHNSKYLYRLVYNQGNAGTGSSYAMGADGVLRERSMQFIISNRFTTYGSYDKYVITAASGATDKYDEGNSAPKYGVIFTILDTEAQTMRSETVVTENLVGNGEYFTVSGIVESNGNLFTALCPQGMSEYGVNFDDGKYVVDQSLVSEGVISPTQHPDNVWVAIYKNMDFNNPVILHDDRISYATSRYRSQFYQTVVPDADGNVYVFSASNAKAESGIQKTTKPSGVIRINKGKEEFDKDYYCNIEELSGGRRMFKVWHMHGDYFLLQMYADITDSSATTEDRTGLAIFKAGDKKFTWVETGVPAKGTIETIASFPYFENGYAYLPITTTTDMPVVYIIDAASATATKGVNVTATSVAAVGKLTSK